MGGCCWGMRWELGRRCRGWRSLRVTRCGEGGYGGIKVAGLCWVDWLFTCLLVGKELVWCEG